MDGASLEQPSSGGRALTGRLHGEVRSGKGNGLEPGIDWSPLGYVPWPGTLNVYVGEAGIGAVRAVQSLLVPAPASVYRNFYAYRVTVNGYAGHALILGSRPVALDVLADMHLRTRLGLADGDTVTIGLPDRARTGRPT